MINPGILGYHIFEPKRGPFCSHAVFLWWFLSGNQSWNSVPLVVLVQETVGHNIDPKTLLEKYFKGPMWWVHWYPIFEGLILMISPIFRIQMPFLLV